MKTKSKQLLLILLFAVSSVILISCTRREEDIKNPDINDNKAFVYYSSEEFISLMKEKVNPLPEDIYSVEYQTVCSEVVKELKGKEEYSIDYPLLIHNPYGTNQCGLYVYVGNPEEKVNIVYTVKDSSLQVPDFTDTAYINRSTENSTEAFLIGMLTGRENTVTIEIKTAKDKELSKQTYHVEIPGTKSDVPVLLKLTDGTDTEKTLGITGLFYEESENPGYAFYDNMGVLRAFIPTKTINDRARIIQAGNRILCEYDLNRFALLDSNGQAAEFISYDEEGMLSEYAYNDKMDCLIYLKEDIETGASHSVLKYKIKTQEWQTLFIFPSIMRGIDEENIVVSGIRLIDGSDLIFTIKPLDTVVRINHIFDQPVIRWFLGNENQWRDTPYEDLLLSGSGDLLFMNTIGNAFYYKIRDQKEGEYQLSLVELNPLDNNDSVLYSVHINENLNQYRIKQEIPFQKQEDDVDSIVYGTHYMIYLEDEKKILEFNDKGEAVLSLDTQSEGFSPMIYKYAMDRYWFQ